MNTKRAKEVVILYILFVLWCAGAVLRVLWRVRTETAYLSGFDYVGLVWQICFTITVGALVSLGFLVFLKENSWEKVEKKLRWFKRQQEDKNKLKGIAGITVMFFLFGAIPGEIIVRTKLGGGGDLALLLSFGFLSVLTFGLVGFELYLRKQ